MLAKLIKHEFKATARIFLPILGTVLVLTGAAALTVKLGGILVLPGGTGWGGPVLGLASGLLCWLTFIAMMAMMAAAVVVTIQRFYKNLLGDEGYLMFTLPVTPAQHITAKLAVGTVWTLLSLALAVLAAAALLFSIPGAAENGMTLARFSAAFRAEMGTGLWMPAAVMLVFFIIGTVNTYLQLYMCMAIGGQWPTSRLGASIAAYLVLNFGLQMLTVDGMLVSGVVLAATGAMDALVPMVEHAAPAAVMCAVMGAVGAVLLVGCVIYFCITRWLLTKRLNLA